MCLGIKLYEENNGTEVGFHLKPVRNYTFVFHRYSLALLRLITVAGLGSFQCPSTISRLIVLCVGLASSLIVLASSITSKSQLKRSAHIFSDVFF